METDVAAFARQLREDGIEAARAEAERILTAARAEAGAIVAEARAAAEQLGRKALADAAAARRRQEDELRLAARDLLLELRREIERVALRLLREPIGRALATEEVVREAVLALLRTGGAGREWEIEVGPPLARELVKAVVDDLFKSPASATVLAGELREAGLVFRARDSGEVLEVTEESVAESFRRLLSPELARLLAPPG